MKPQSKIDVLRSILTFSPPPSLFRRPLNFFSWYLRNVVHALLDGHERLIYTNVQCISVSPLAGLPLDHKAFKHIPTLFDSATLDEQGIIEKLIQAMAFMKTVSRFFSHNEGGIAVHLNTLREKLIVAVVKSESRQMSGEYVRSNKDSHILSLMIPDFFDPSIYQQHFADVVLPIKELYQPYSNSLWKIIDGEKLYAAIDKQFTEKRMQSFYPCIEEFLGRADVIELIDRYIERLSAFSPDLMNNQDAKSWGDFIKVTFLHSLLKSSRCSYLIPSARFMTDQNRFFAVNVVTTEKELNDQTLSYLYFALSSFVAKLDDLNKQYLWSSFSESRPPIRFAKNLIQSFSIRKTTGSGPEHITKNQFGDIIGCSEAMQSVFKDITNASKCDTTVLISGKTGTGKELVARAIHNLSNRKNHLLVPVNSAAIPEPLMESEFFGHARGAFTGAHGKRKGFFDAANGGTLFLDEIGDMALGMQVKLLRVLQEGEYLPLGDYAGRVRKSNFRLICATNKDLEEEIKAGRFREDLYYRIKVFEIKLSSLNDRREDIPLLAEFLLHRLADRQNKKQISITKDGLLALKNRNWPGNVRELQNVIERAVACSTSNTVIGIDVLFPTNTSNTAAAHTEDLSPEESIRYKALETSGWIQAKAAELLGVTRQAFSKYLKKHPRLRSLYEHRAATLDSSTNS